MLATYCLLWFLHPSVLLDFGAPNIVRTHRACIRSLGCRHPGVIKRVLEDRRLWPQHGVMAEAQLRWPRCLTGANVAGMDRCWPAAWNHYLGGFWDGQSRRRRAQEFWSRQRGRKSPLVGQWHIYFPIRPCALYPIRWCAPWGLACWPGSWVSFRPNWHSLSHRHSPQNWLPMWRPCQGQRSDWGTKFYRLLFVHDLNLFCRYRRPPVRQDWGRRYKWALGQRGQCRHVPAR